MKGQIRYIRSREKIALIVSVHGEVAARMQYNYLKKRNLVRPNFWKKFR